jgi:hypothetical protein
MIPMLTSVQIPLPLRPASSTPDQPSDVICQPLKSIRAITSDYPRKASSRHLVDFLHRRRPRNLIPFSVFRHTNRVGPNRRLNPCPQRPTRTHPNPLRRPGGQTRCCASHFRMRHPAGGIPVQSSGCFHARLAREAENSALTLSSPNPTDLKLSGFLTVIANLPSQPSPPY